jgi:CTP synthase (UTP-ammonia lyase)
VEHARHVVGIAGARHAEYGDAGPDAVIVPVACRVGAPGAPALSGALKIRLADDSLARRVYGCGDVEEEFFCNYELNPTWEAPLAATGLRFTGRGENGEVRVLERPDRRFFLGTSYLPQRRSRPGAPHPLIVAYVRAVAAFAARRARS